jgi:hypothetical protein
VRVLVVGLFLVNFAMSVDLAPSLPTWSEESRKVVAEDEWLPGGMLLAGETEDVPVDSTEVEPPTSAETTDLISANEIPEKFLDDYFAKRPEGFLVDPQGLLGPSARRDRETFLNYHSADSQIDFYVYIFGAEQQIPSGVREEEISERLFSQGKPSLTLFYYLGAPKRAEIFLSPSLTDAVSDAERRRILQSSALAALEKPDSIAQLEAFCVQTSIRIYWIEKEAGLVEGGSPVAEVETPIVTNADGTSRMESLRKMFDAFWFKWGAIISVSLSGIVITLGFWWSARRRARYRFPEFEVAPRLGGAHAAGVGAVIGFGSTTQSPSVQHSGVQDFFGGI